MPKENKHSRGRREEKKLKRKRGKVEEVEDVEPKRQKPQDPADDVVFTGTDNADAETPQDGGAEGQGGEAANERPFYGMLEDEEQEYFRRADELLELNDFPSDEERSMFLNNVYKEAEGKELKIACSQSCSRLMERLILLSTSDQKKRLFGKFSGNFAHLVQHRFASHCCETLFIQSAPVVTEELTADSGTVETDGEDVFVSMENLFLFTLNELEGQMISLLTDRFASHTLRVLLIILSGRPLEKSSTKTLLQSKRKEKISITGHSTAPTEFTLSKRAVPSSFNYAIEKIITDTIVTMDTSFIRILATHPTGNPTLQLLLELELSNPNTKKGVNSPEKTIISSLLPDDVTQENSESAVFINGILYDAIGSRLLETIMTYAPGKQFKLIYKQIFKDRIAALARNEISSYVVIKVLTRLSREDLEEAVRQIHPQIRGFVERRRIVVIKILLERCYARGAETDTLTAAIASSYGSEPSTLALKMACIDDIDHLIASTATGESQPTESAEEEPEAEKKKGTQPQILKPSSTQLHGSLLAQSMLNIPGAPSKLIQESLLAMTSPQLLAFSLWTATSHIIQSALSPSSDVSFRRKLINKLLFPVISLDTEPIHILALSQIGSHVLDCLLTSTASPPPNSTAAPLFQLTERIAGTLSTHESELRDSWSGRIVWRNWSLDLFKRRRGDWVKKVKEAGAVAATAAITSAIPAASESAPSIEKIGAAVSEGQEKGSKSAKNPKRDKKGKNMREKDEGKSAIQLAREKFAKVKAAKATNPNRNHRGAGGGVKVGKGPATGVNDVEVAV